MTRNQWLILGSLVICVIVCVGVFGFLLGVYVFQRPNSLASSSPTPALQQPAYLFPPTLVFIATAKASDRIPTPSRVYRANDVVTDQGWEYVVKVEKSKTFTSTFPFGTPHPGNPAQGIYVVVYLALTNVSKQNTYTISYDGYEIADVAGTRYAVDGFASMDMARTLKVRALNSSTSYVPGVAVPTVLVFDVNPLATGLKLHLLSSSLYVSLD